MGVEAEQAQELALLALAQGAAATPFLDYLPALWAANGAAARDVFDAQQMRNATCVCGAGATAALEGTAGFVSEADHQAGSNCTGARGGPHGRGSLLAARAGPVVSWYHATTPPLACAHSLARRHHAAVAACVGGQRHRDDHDAAHHRARHLRRGAGQPHDPPHGAQRDDARVRRRAGLQSMNWCALACVLLYLGPHA